MSDPNTELLAHMAEALGDLRQRLVFVGGSASNISASEKRCGRGDYVESHDLEDVLSVVDGRPEIVAEAAQADPDVCRYVAQVFARLLLDEGFLNALPGLVMDGSPATRAPVVLNRLRSIVGLLDHD